VAGSVETISRTGEICSKSSIQREEINVIRRSDRVKSGEKVSSKSFSGNSESQSGRRGGCPGLGEILD
jgi:hypothetical protein